MIRDYLEITFDITEDTNTAKWSRAFVEDNYDHFDDMLYIKIHRTILKRKTKDYQGHGFLISFDNKYDVLQILMNWLITHGRYAHYGRDIEFVPSETLHLHEFCDFIINTPQLTVDYIYPDTFSACVRYITVMDETIMVASECSHASLMKRYIKMQQKAKQHQREREALMQQPDGTRETFDINTDMTELTASISGKMTDEEMQKLKEVSNKPRTTVQNVLESDEYKLGMQKYNEYIEMKKKENPDYNELKELPSLSVFDICELAKVEKIDDDYWKSKYNDDIIKWTRDEAEQKSNVYEANKNMSMNNSRRKFFTEVIGDITNEIKQLDEEENEEEHDDEEEHDEEEHEKEHGEEYNYNSDI